MSTENQSEILPGAINVEFVEALYQNYTRDPSSVPPDWQNYFSSLANGDVRFAKPRFGPSFRPPSIFNPSAPVPERVPDHPATPQLASLQDRVHMLIRLYRVRGHRIARIDPLGLPQPAPPELEPGFLGFTDKDMDLPVHSETFQYDGALTLRSLLERLRNTYCRSIVVQYMQIDDLGILRWLQR